ncbi:GlsB/YeaQ/YmgE family stress response membrane protein [Salinarimonas sp.]|uniref:GlsB/YeaQ/YmgE family stress response membrane protein n=1 Tax=Salinarimonas sp. TaxID=2766526 RepID=UPI00391AD416
MSIIAWIVVGLIAGFIAEKIMGRDHGLLTNLVVGVIGAFVGGFIISTILGFEYAQGFNLATIITAIIGAVVFLWIWGMIRGRSRA